VRQQRTGTRFARQNARVNRNRARPRKFFRLSFGRFLARPFACVRSDSRDDSGGMVASRAIVAARAVSASAIGHLTRLRKRSTPADTLAGGIDRLCGVSTDSVLSLLGFVC